MRLLTNYIILSSLLVTHTSRETLRDLCKMPDENVNNIPHYSISFKVNIKVAIAKSNWLKKRSTLKMTTCSIAEVYTQITYCFTIND